MSINRFMKTRSYEELKTKCCEDSKKKCHHIATVVRVKGKTKYEEHGYRC